MKKKENCKGERINGTMQVRIKKIEENKGEIRIKRETKYNKGE